MKVEFDDEHFINCLAEKYHFERDNENKVKVVFSELNDDELIDLLNRYFYEYTNGWKTYKTSIGDIVVDCGTNKTTYTIQQFRKAFN